MPECYLLGVTIPDAQVKVDIIIENRNNVNALIRAYFENREQNILNQRGLLDLNKELPYSSEYFDDAIHFNVTGYDKIGALVYKHLKSIL